MMAGGVDPIVVLCRTEVKFVPMIGELMDVVFGDHLGASDSSDNDHFVFCRAQRCS